MGTIVKADVNFATISQDEQTGDLFVIAGNQIFRYIYQSKMVQRLTGSRSVGYVDGYLHNCLFSNPSALITLDQTTTLVADTGNDQIRIIDLDENATGTLAFQLKECTTSSDVIQRMHCSLLRRPYSILRLNNTLLIGKRDRMVASK